MHPRPHLRSVLPILLITAGSLLLAGWFLYRQYQGEVQLIAQERLSALDVAFRASIAFDPGDPLTSRQGVYPAVDGDAVLVGPGRWVPFQLIHDKLLGLLPSGDYAMLLRRDQYLRQEGERDRGRLVASLIHPDYLMEEPASSQIVRDLVASPTAQALMAQLRRDPEVQKGLAAGIAVGRPILVKDQGYVAAFVPLPDLNGRQVAYVFGFTSAPVLVSMRNAARQVAVLGTLLIVLLGASAWLLVRRGRQLEVEIAHRQRDETDLRLAASVFANSREGILIADANNRVIKVNPAFERITGFTQAEVVGGNPSLLKSGIQGPEFYSQLWQSLQTHDTWRGEIWNRRKNGEVYPEMLSISAVRDEHGKTAHYIGIFTDISRLKAHEAELDRIAHRDPLTGVPNRRLFADRLQQSIALTRRNGQHLAVCYLDLDGFKAVNDQLGHAAGDTLLVEMAKRLQGEMRESDTVARLGGDEFVLVFCELARPQDLDLLIARLLQVISTPMRIADTEVSVSASVGISLFPLDDSDPDTLLRHADYAMYRAKAAGKNRFHMFNPDADQGIE